jgi:hypothetical protein
MIFGEVIMGILPDIMAAVAVVTLLIIAFVGLKMYKRKCEDNKPYENSSDIR